MNLLIRSVCEVRDGFSVSVSDEQEDELIELGSAGCSINQILMVIVEPECNFHAGSLNRVIRLHHLAPCMRMHVYFWNETGSFSLS